MTSKTSRRAVLAGAATLPALALIPAMALAAEPDIEQLWRERSALLVQLAENSAAHSKASDTLPTWALPGPSRIMKDGSYSDDMTGWPEIENPMPSAYGDSTLVRPSFREIRHRYESSPFKGRADVRADYRANVRRLIARQREKRRLENAAGLTALGKRSDELCNSLFEVEKTIQRACFPGAYAVLAAITIIEISYHFEPSKLQASILQTLLPVLPQYLALEAQKEIKRYAEKKEDDEADDEA